MRKLLMAATLLIGASTVAADEHPLSMWRLDGDSNRVYLLGSVHLLREQDYPIPSAIDDAYRDAEILIMELDMDDLDPVVTQQQTIALGRPQKGQTLATLLGAESYAEASRLATELNLPLAILDDSEPWLAAISIEQLMLARIGFNPEFGVESHLLKKAVRDGKEVLGFEEFAQQLGYLDSLSLPSQRTLLLETLREAATIEPMMDDMVAAWRHGDLAFLESSILSDLQAFPELYEALVVRRNQDWVGQISALLDDEQDYLIVVGALHLVGSDSVPTLLRQRGRTVKQMRQSD